MCLYPDCEHPVRCRSLCPVHYATAQRLVKEGRTTWKELEDTGRCGASNRSPYGAYTEWFLGETKQAHGS